MIGIFSFRIHNIFWETHTDVFADSMSQNQGALDLLQGKVQGGVGGEGGEGRGQEGQVGVVVVVNVRGEVATKTNTPVPCSLRLAVAAAVVVQIVVDAEPSRGLELLTSWALLAFTGHLNVGKFWLLVFDCG